MMKLKATKKTGFQPLFRRYIFGKTIGGGGLNLPPPLKVFLGLKEEHTLRFLNFLIIGYAIQ